MGELGSSPRRLRIVDQNPGKRKTNPAVHGALLATRRVAAIRESSLLSRAVKWNDLPLPAGVISEQPASFPKQGLRERLFLANAPLMPKLLPVAVGVDFQIKSMFAPCQPLGRFLTGKHRIGPAFLIGSLFAWRVDRIGFRSVFVPVALDLTRRNSSNLSHALCSGSQHGHAKYC